jgi:hypothetical protein
MLSLNYAACRSPSRRHSIFIFAHYPNTAVPLNLASRDHILIAATNVKEIRGCHHLVFSILVLMKSIA